MSDKGLDAVYKHIVDLRNGFRKQPDIEGILRAHGWLHEDDVVEGEKTCDYPKICEEMNRTRKTRHCDECPSFRPALVKDLIK